LDWSCVVKVLSSFVFRDSTSWGELEAAPCDPEEEFPEEEFIGPRLPVEGP
jgi:hypothetical protein